MNNFHFLSSQKLQNVVQQALLVIITLATIIAVSQEIYTMFIKMEVKISELLLLFIYLEIITMVVIYIESGQMPVRIPLYIAMVALARYLILDMENMTEWAMFSVSGSILLISLAVLIVRVGHTKFPYPKSSEE